MNAVVYTKDNCPYCVRVKEVLKAINVTVTEYRYPEDFDRDQFYAEFGPGSTFPQVIIEGEHIGGCKETVEYLVEKNLV